MKLYSGRGKGISSQKSAHKLWDHAHGRRRKKEEIKGEWLGEGGGGRGDCEAYQPEASKGQNGKKKKPTPIDTGCTAASMIKRRRTTSPRVSQGRASRFTGRVENSKSGRGEKALKKTGAVKNHLITSRNRAENASDRPPITTAGCPGREGVRPTSSAEKSRKKKQRMESGPKEGGGGLEQTLSQLIFNKEGPYASRLEKEI